MPSPTEAIEIVVAGLVVVNRWMIVRHGRIMIVMVEMLSGMATVVSGRVMCPPVSF
jgi:hypothetical protein